LTQYRRVTDGRTDGQTDGIAIASTALAMRALRRAVKITHPKSKSQFQIILFEILRNTEGTTAELLLV